jgi:hypothetical protein
MSSISGSSVSVRPKKREAQAEVVNESKRKLSDDEDLLSTGHSFQQVLSRAQTPPADFSSDASTLGPSASQVGAQPRRRAVARRNKVSSQPEKPRRGRRTREAEYDEGLKTPIKVIPGSRSSSSSVSRPVHTMMTRSRSRASAEEERNKAAESRAKAEEESRLMKAPRKARSKETMVIRKQLSGRGYEVASMPDFGDRVDDGAADASVQPGLDARKSLEFSEAGSEVSSVSMSEIDEEEVIRDSWLTEDESSASSGFPVVSDPVLVALEEQAAERAKLLAALKKTDPTLLRWAERAVLPRFKPVRKDIRFSNLRRAGSFAEIKDVHKVESLQMRNRRRALSVSELDLIADRDIIRTTDELEKWKFNMDETTYHSMTDDTLRQNMSDLTLNSSGTPGSTKQSAPQDRSPRKIAGIEIPTPLAVLEESSELAEPDWDVPPDPFYFYYDFNSYCGFCAMRGHEWAHCPYNKEGTLMTKYLINAIFGHESDDEVDSQAGAQGQSGKTSHSSPPIDANATVQNAVVDPPNEEDLRQQEDASAFSSWRMSRAAARSTASRDDDAIRRAQEVARIAMEKAEKASEEAKRAAKNLQETASMVGKTRSVPGTKHSIKHRRDRGSIVSSASMLRIEEFEERSEERMDRFERRMMEMANKMQSQMDLNAQRIERGFAEHRQQLQAPVERGCRRRQERTNHRHKTRLQARTAKRTFSTTAIGPVGLRSERPDDPRYIDARGTSLCSHGRRQ